VVKWWNEKINEIKRSRVRSPARPGQSWKNSARNVPTYLVLGMCMYM
jgi:hypothetical protein